MLLAVGMVTGSIQGFQPQIPPPPNLPKGPRRHATRQPA
jgi:hypothetical protein